MKVPKGRFIFSPDKSDLIIKGDFDIYQARLGGIILKLGNLITELTIQQIGELKIDLFELLEFNDELYRLHYYNYTAEYNKSEYELEYASNKFNFIQETMTGKAYLVAGVETLEELLDEAEKLGAIINIKIK